MEDNVRLQFKMPRGIRKMVPFEQTDRYVRGRIIDALRERSSISSAHIRQCFPHITDERYVRIVARLETDGLIMRRGRRILLP